MASKLSLLLLFVISSSFIWTTNSSTFYKAFGSDSLTTINQALYQLEQQKQSSTTVAYTGGLKMKKSSYVKGIAKKLSVFKEGRELLEQAITRYPKNAEFRFIRLTIQENAPKVLKYNKNTTDDKKAIIAGYKKMDSKTRAYIMDYARHSNLLKTSELK
ncbi:MAG: hypothetical protein ACRBFS_10395 [Aureispira sp.]